MRGLGIEERSRDEPSEVARELAEVPERHGERVFDVERDLDVGGASRNGRHPRRRELGIAGFCRDFGERGPAHYLPTARAGSTPNQVGT